MLNRSLPYSCAPLLQYLSAAVVCLLLLATTGNCEDDSNRAFNGSDNWYYPIDMFGYFQIENLSAITSRQPLYNIYAGFGADFSPITSDVQIILHNIQHCQVVRLMISHTANADGQYVILKPTKGSFSSLNYKDVANTLSGEEKTMATSIAELYPSGKHWKIAFDNRAYELYSPETNHADSSDILAFTDGSKSIYMFIAASSPYCQVNVVSGGSRSISGKSYFHRGYDPKTPFHEVPYARPTLSSRNLPSIIALGDQGPYELACPSVTEHPIFNKEDSWDVKKDKISYMYYKITQQASTTPSYNSYYKLVVEPSECAWVRICYHTVDPANDIARCGQVHPGNPVAEFLFRNQIYFRPDDDTPYTFDVPMDSLFSFDFFSSDDIKDSMVFGYPAHGHEAAIDEEWKWNAKLMPDKDAVFMIVERAPNCRARLTVDDSSTLVVRHYKDTCYKNIE